MLQSNFVALVWIYFTASVVIPILCLYLARAAARGMCGLEDTARAMDLILSHGAVLGVFIPFRPVERPQDTMGRLRELVAKINTREGQEALIPFIWETGLEPNDPSGMGLYLQSALKTVKLRPSWLYDRVDYAPAAWKGCFPREENNSALTVDVGYHGDLEYRVDVRRFLDEHTEEPPEEIQELWDEWIADRYILSAQYEIEDFAAILVDHGYDVSFGAYEGDSGNPVVWNSYNEAGTGDMAIQAVDMWINGDPYIASGLCGGDPRGHYTSRGLELWTGEDDLSPIYAISGALQEIHVWWTDWDESMILESAGYGLADGPDSMFEVFQGQVKDYEDMTPIDDPALVAALMRLDRNEHVTDEHDAPRLDPEEYPSGIYGVAYDPVTQDELLMICDEAGRYALARYNRLEGRSEPGGGAPMHSDLGDWAFFHEGQVWTSRGEAHFSEGWV